MQKRIYKDMFQPSANMGAVLALSGIKGVYIIYHGAPGCNTIAGHVRTDQVLLGAYTGLLLTGPRHDHIVMGTSIDRLRQALKFVKATLRRRPSLVAIVNADATALIGDDIVGAAKAFESETGIPSLAIDSPGMKGWDIVGYDIVYKELLARFAKKEGVHKREDAVNIICPYELWSHNWIFDFEEIVNLLKKVGIRINCVLTKNTAIEDIKNFASAKLNIMLTPEELPLFTKESEKLGVYNFGESLSLPYGVCNSEEWLIALGEEMGVVENCQKVLKEGADRVKSILGLNYSFTWQANLMMQKRAAVIGRAGFATAMARCLYYDFDTYPVVIALQAATPQAFEISKRLLDPIIRDGVEIKILENPTYLEFAKAVKEGEIDFAIGSRLDKQLIEGMRIPHLSLGSAYYFMSYRYIPYPYVGYDGMLYLSQELAHVVHEMFLEKEKWKTLLYKELK
jgi:nitrogenase molybdenum-iron protein alpha/beta subunit